MYTGLCPYIQEFHVLGSETPPFSQASSRRGAYIIKGFFWVGSADIVYVTEKTVELYKVSPVAMATGAWPTYAGRIGHCLCRQ